MTMRRLVVPGCGPGMNREGKGACEAVSPAPLFFCPFALWREFPQVRLPADQVSGQGQQKKNVPAPAFPLRESGARLFPAYFVGLVAFSRRMQC